MAERFAAGGRLFAFGNGGSATDADGVAQLYTRPPSGRPCPPGRWWRTGPCITALGNDVGYDKVFSRQIIAHARAGDMALGYSTSGNSENLLVAFAEARKRGLLTIGFAGIDGGRMARRPQRPALRGRAVAERAPGAGDAGVGHPRALGLRPGGVGRPQA